MPRLEVLRREMDRLNLELRGLLQQRARLALRIGRLKRARGLTWSDPARERAMLAALLKRPGRGFDRQALERIFRAIIRASRALLRE